MHVHRSTGRRGRGRPARRPHLRRPARPVTGRAGPAPVPGHGVPPRLRGTRRDAATSRARSADRRTSPSATRRSPSGSAPRSARRTGRSARTAATTTRSSAAPRPTPCCSSCSAARAASAAARAARCTSLSVEHGYLGSHAIIGAHLPVAAGLGWASQVLDDGRVTACFFGDGATNIGAFHEALNLAAVWHLPVVFVCENNGYMEYTPIETVVPVTFPAADRASAYGLPAITVDGNDVSAVREVAAAAVATARRGEGPVLVEARTYRHGGHSVADPAAYRPVGEVEAWKARDPLALHRDAAMAPGRRPRGLRGRPARRPRTGGGDRPPGPGSARAGRRRRLDRRLERREQHVAELTYREAVASGLAREMDRDPLVVLVGEDLRAGGVFKTTKGLFERFGPVRVRDTPISEQAIVGAAMGAAMGGLRPVAEIMFSDFYATCWDGVVNEIAKARYMSAGRAHPAARHPLRERRRDRLRRPAQPGHRELGDVRPRPEDRRARRPPGTPSACSPQRCAATTRCSSSSTRRSTACGARCRTATTSSPSAGRRSARPGRRRDPRRRWPRRCRCASRRPTVLAAQGVGAEVVDLRCLVPLDAAHRARLGRSNRPARRRRGEPRPARVGRVARRDRRGGGVRRPARARAAGQRRERPAARRRRISRPRSSPARRRSSPRCSGRSTTAASHPSRDVRARPGPPVQGPGASSSARDMPQRPHGTGC